MVGSGSAGRGCRKCLDPLAALVKLRGMKHKETNLQSRRAFLRNGSIASAGLVFYGAAAQFTRAQAPSSRMRVAVMGLSRGLALVSSALAIDNTEVAYV